MARGVFWLSVNKSLSWLWRFSVYGAAALLAAGLLLRLTVRDRFDGLSLVFYATPWALQMLAGVVCAIRWRKHRRVRGTFLVAAIFCASVWAWTSFRLAPKDAGRAEFRVAYWNIARPGWRIDGVLERTKSLQADLLGFGECKAGGPLQVKWNQQLAPKLITELHRQMMLVSAQHADLVEAGSLNKAGEYELRRVTLGGRRVLVLSVDFDGDPRQTRRAPFERLYQIVKAHEGEPLIVMGDFNTPIDSIYYEKLREILQDAFETAGSGYAATWPMVAPIMSLDHIWLSKHFRVVRCEHRTSIYSDHRAVVVDLGWR